MAPSLRAFLLACLSSAWAVAWELSKRRGMAVVRRRGAARKAERAMMLDMASAIDELAKEWRVGRGRRCVTLTRVGVLVVRLPELCLPSPRLCQRRPELLAERQARAKT